MMIICNKIYFDFTDFYFEIEFQLSSAVEKLLSLWINRNRRTNSTTTQRLKPDWGDRRLMWEQSRQRNEKDG